MDKPRRVLVDAHPRFDQHLVVGPCHRVDIPFVRHVGGNDPHVQPRLGRRGQRRDHLAADDEVGGGDVDIPVRLVDEVQVHRLPHRLVVQGAVGVGLHHPVAGHRLPLVPPGVVEGVVIPGPPDVVPQGKEHQGEAPHRVATQQHRRVLPVAVLGVGVDVLVRQVDAAGEAGVAVDDADLPMVPVVQPAGEHRHEGVKDAAPDALLLQHPLVVGRQRHHAAQVVVHHPDVQTGLGFALQHLQDGVPHPPLLDDEVFQKDIVLRLLQFLQHPGELDLPQGKVLHRGVLVGGRAGDPPDVLRLVVGVGALLFQVHVPGQGYLVDALKVFPHLHQPALLLAAHLVAAQHQVEDAAEHRHQQDGDDPGDLVGGVAAVVDDVQHRRHADGDADGVEVDEILLEPQQHHQQDSQLGQDGQPHQHHPVEQQLEQLFGDGLSLFWFSVHPSTSGLSQPSVQPVPWLVRSLSRWVMATGSPWAWRCSPMAWAKATERWRPPVQPMAMVSWLFPSRR